MRETISRYIEQMTKASYKLGKKSTNSKASTARRASRCEAFVRAISIAFEELLPICGASRNTEIRRRVQAQVLALAGHRAIVNNVDAVLLTLGAAAGKFPTTTLVVIIS